MGSREGRTACLPKRLGDGVDQPALTGQLALAVGQAVSVAALVAGMAKLRGGFTGPVAHNEVRSNTAAMTAQHHAASIVYLRWLCNNEMAMVLAEGFEPPLNCS